METESAKDGKLYDRTYRLKSLIPILSDRQIQIHQRLKSKGYGAEEEKENETVVITLTMNDDWATVENAKEIIQEMVEESGYGGNFGEYYELIVEFETENEKFLGAVEHYISDENLPYEIEGFFANYDYPIGSYAESFGADEEEEEEDVMYHWDEEAGLFFDYMILEQPDGEKIIVYWIMNEDLDQVGKGQISLRNDNLEIDSIFIEPSYQRKGIATSFVNHVVDYWVLTPTT